MKGRERGRNDKGEGWREGGNCGMKELVWRELGGRNGEGEERGGMREGRNGQEKVRNNEGEGEKHIRKKEQ